jgi:hypothetical protein
MMCSGQNMVSCQHRSNSVTHGPDRLPSSFKVARPLSSHTVIRDIRRPWKRLGTHGAKPGTDPKLRQYNSEDDPKWKDAF